MNWQLKIVHKEIAGFILKALRFFSFDTFPETSIYPYRILIFSGRKEP
jgi:hypothetical protein